MKRALEYSLRSVLIPIRRRRLALVLAAVLAVCGCSDESDDTGTGGGTGGATAAGGGGGMGGGGGEGGTAGALSDILGVWEGTGTQGSRMWTIRATIEPEEQTIEYPSLGCGGTWELLEAPDVPYLFSEEITFGQSACIVTGLVELIDGPDPDELEYLYYIDEPDRQSDTVTAFGTLTRVE